ncbi:hypothetical protein L1C32_17265, partial [Klebsiella pneumoniae]
VFTGQIMINHSQFCFRGILWFSHKIAPYSVGCPTFGVQSTALAGPTGYPPPRAIQAGAVAAPPDKNSGVAFVPGGGDALPGLQSVRPVVNLFTAVAEILPPGRGY